MKQFEAVLIGDMHLILKEPLPKEVANTDEILVRVRLSSENPEVQHAEKMTQSK